jgi:hypothetical protein
VDPVVVTLEHSAATLRRRKVLSRTWGAVVVAWSLVRTLVVWAALGDYGLNPWIYLCIDLASAFVDAFTTPRMVLAFIDDEYKTAARWLLASALAFIVPDLYLFVGTRTLPRRVIVIIAVIIATTTTVAVVSVVRKVLAGRRERDRLVEEVLRGS